MTGARVGTGSVGGGWRSAECLKHRMPSCSRKPSRSPSPSASWSGATPGTPASSRSSPTGSATAGRGGLDPLPRDRVEVGAPGDRAGPRVVRRRATGRPGGTSRSAITTPARGYYMFAENYQRLDDGKRLRIWPFALIWASKDGRSRKTATSDEAVIDLSQPFGLVKQGNEPLAHRPRQADRRRPAPRRQGDPRRPDDDLRIGPLAHARVRREGPPDHHRVPGLPPGPRPDPDRPRDDDPAPPEGPRPRRGPAPAAAPGSTPRSAFFHSDVHIVVKNVGPTGILPGTAKPEKGGQTRSTSGPTARC